LDFGRQSAPEGQVLNPNAFAVPAGLGGNFSRNSLRGFPYSQTDMAVWRRFNLSERLRLDARAEYVNVLNHPNFSSPQNFLGTPGFATVAPGNTLNIGQGGPLVHGQAPIYAPGGPRSAQFSLKLTF
jgi:hypothetical protein